MNTHYAVLVFSGDPANEHPDEELRGSHPTMQILACGPEQFVIDAVSEWTLKHPLRTWERVEILARDPILVGMNAVAAEAYSSGEKP